MAHNNTILNLLEVVVGTADIRSSNQVKSGNAFKDGDEYILRF